MPCATLVIVVADTSARSAGVRRIMPSVLPTSSRWVASLPWAASDAVARLAREVSVRTNQVAPATTTKLIPSATTTPPRPKSSTTTPPSGDPTSRERLSLAAFAALAAISWSGPTSRGRSATFAGLLIRVSVDWTAATRNAGQIRSGVTARSGSSVTAWRRFVTTSVRRRSQRSIRLPAIGPSTTEIASSIRNSAAVSVPDDVSVNTYTGQRDTKQPVTGVVDEPARPDQPEVAPRPW